MKKILGLLIALFMASQVYASIGVSPTKIEMNATKARNNYAMTSIEVFGDKTEVMRYRIVPGYFKVDEKGDFLMINNATDQYDLSKKIKFVPSEFTIQPGKTQKVRISIPNIKQLPDGESRAILYLEDVNVKTKDINTGIRGVAAQMIIKMRMGVPLYVDAGNFYRQGEIESFNITEENGEKYLNYKVKSTGNSRIRYEGKAQIIKDKKLVKETSFHGTVAAPNSVLIRKDQVEFPHLAPGEYTVRLILSYTDEKGKKQHMQKDTTINVKGEI